LQSRVVSTGAAFQGATERTGRLRLMADSAEAQAHGTLVEEAERKLDAAGVQSRGEDSGWMGGRVWLVPTERPIGEWQPVAERSL